MTVSTELQAEIDVFIEAFSQPVPLSSGTANRQASWAACAVLARNGVSSVKHELAIPAPRHGYDKMVNFTERTITYMLGCNPTIGEH